MSKQWYFFPHDRDAIRALERRAGIPAVLAQLLLCRGLSNPEDVRDFLDPQLTQLRDPDQLPGVSLAAGLMHRAVTDGERIVVYGDYDADGMCATAILYRCLTLLGANVSYHVPNRLSDGYGLMYLNIFRTYCHFLFPQEKILLQTLRDSLQLDLDHTKKRS